MTSRGEETGTPPLKPLTLEAIDSGVALVEEKKEPDSKDIMEKAALEKAQLENKLFRSKVKDAKADRKLRQKYANRILRFLEAYCVAVGVFAIAEGFHIKGFDLGDNILLAMVGSTAVAAIGLVGFIAKGLFRPPDK